MQGSVCRISGVRVNTKPKQSSFEMEGNEKVALLLLDRASRATRGKRLSRLLDDEVE